MRSGGRWQGVRSGRYRSAWLFLIAAVACGATGAIINSAAGNPSKLSKSTVLEVGGLVIVLYIVAVVLLVFALLRFASAYDAPKEAQRQAAALQLEAERLNDARRLAEQLLAGDAPTVAPVWDVVMQRGERVLLDCSVGYSRYYGADAAASYTHASTRHYGNVGVSRVVLDHAIDGVGNRMRAEQAASAAATRWRDQQQSRVVVTDRRLLCQVQAHGWLSFDHRATTAIQPGPETKSVVLEYPNAAPLRLSGPLITQIVVVVVWALYGANGLREHPALAEVRSLAPFPEINGHAEPSDAEAQTAPTPVALDPTAERAPPDGQSATEAPVADLLTFVAAHELVLVEQVARLLDVSESDAAKRLQELVVNGLASRVRFSAHSPVAYRITQSGADQLDSASARQRPLDLAGYKHALAVQES